MYRFPLFALGLAMFGAAALAQVRDIGADHYAVALHQVDLHPTAPARALQTLRRIGQAPMSACGATEFSCAR